MGVVGLGMAAAATSGAGIAYADDNSSEGSSASASADRGPADRASAKTPSTKHTPPKSSSDDTKTDGDKTSSVDSSKKAPADTDTGATSSESSAVDVEAKDPVVRPAEKRSGSRKALPATSVGADPAPRSVVGTNSKTTSVSRKSKPADKVAQPKSDPPDVVTLSAVAPSTPAAADPAPAAESVSLMVTQAKVAAPAPAPNLASVLKALLTSLQMTLLNQFAAVKPVQRPIETPVVAEEVSAETDVESANATLAAAEAVPPSKEDAGLSGPFLTTSASKGKTFNIKTYGATSNNSADNDATVINAVINAAQPGDVVYMPNGTYHIKTTINLKPGVSLVGQSRDGTILASASGNTQLHALVYAPPGADNLTIANFKITLASGRAPKAGVRVGLTDGGPISRVTVKNLFIEKFERFGVSLEDANNVFVYGNTIKNATALDGGGQGYGVLISGYDSYNNWVRSNAVGPVIRHAILIQGAHNNLVEYNRITGTVSGAIDLHGEDEYANEIRYNTISNGVRNGTTVSPNGAGIEVGEYSGVIGTTTMHDNSGPGNYIHHNTVYNYSYGLRITNNSNYTYIEYNTFRNNSEVGILANLAPLNHLYLAHNQVNYNGHGIILYGVQQAALIANTVRYNSGYGIGVDPASTDYIITGNTATNNKVNVYLMNSNGIYSAKATSIPTAQQWWV